MGNYDWNQIVADLKKYLHLMYTPPADTAALINGTNDMTEVQDAEGSTTADGTQQSGTLASLLAVQTHHNRTSHGGHDGTGSGPQHDRQISGLGERDGDCDDADSIHRPFHDGHGGLLRLGLIHMLAAGALGTEENLVVPRVAYDHAQCLLPICGA